MSQRVAVAAIAGGFDSADFARVPGDESAGTTAESEPEVLPPQRRTHVRRVAGLAAGIAAATGCAVLWNSRLGCVQLSAHAFSSVASFVEEYPGHMLNVVERDGDEDAVQKWLAVAGAANKLVQQKRGLLDPVKVANDAVNAALNEKDPAKAKEVMEKAMQRSVAETVGKRKDLKGFVASQRRGLKGKKHSSPSPQQQAQTAFCVFDVLQATNSLAFVAANLNDAFQTCGHFSLDEMVSKDGTTKASHSKVCAINAATAFTELANLAAMLSLAVNDCAATLVPNVNAECAAAVTGLVYGVSSAGAGGALMAAGCNGKKFMGALQPQGVVPSSIGSNGAMGFPSPPNRRLEANTTAAEGPAPARQLLFGGGRGSTATQCGIEVSNILWAAARMALSINAAVHGNIGSQGKCPPSNIFGGHIVKGKIYEMSEAYCAENVGAILVGYAQIIGFIQIAIVDCGDVLNLDAICGAGVTSLFGSFSAITQAASGMHLVCDVFQDPLLHKALQAAAKIDNLSGQKISNILGGGKVLGRRLAEGEEPRSEDWADMTDENMERRFGTPAEAFKKLGYDLNDKAFREQKPNIPEVEDLAGLFEEQPRQGTSGQCAA